MTDPGPPRKARRDLESPEMKALFHWANLQICVYPELLYLYHCPSGEVRDPITAAKLKAMGVKRGIPDTFLPVPAGGYHGLYIEMKAPDEGKVSKDQKRVIRFLQDMGYRVDVCYGWMPAREILIEYLNTFYRERRISCPKGNGENDIPKDRSKTLSITAAARS
jgi:hypothetical protein